MWISWACKWQPDFARSGSTRVAGYMKIVKGACLTMRPSSYPQMAARPPVHMVEALRRL